MLQTYVGTWGICGLLKHNETFKTLQIGIIIYDKDPGYRMQLKAFQTYDHLPIENGFNINCCNEKINAVKNSPATPTKENKKSNPCKSV